MTHPNVNLLRAGYDAFGKGDMEAVRKLFSPNIIWHVAGRSPLAGTYKGIDEVFGFFAEIVRQSEGTFQIELHDVIANDQHAIAMTVDRAQREGKTLHASGVGVYHIAGGAVTEAWFTSQDPYAEDEFWA